MRTESIGPVTLATYRAEESNSLATGMTSQACEFKPRVATKRWRATSRRSSFEPRDLECGTDTCGIDALRRSFFTHRHGGAPPRLCSVHEGGVGWLFPAHAKLVLLGGHDGLEGGRARASTHGSLSCTTLAQLLHAQRDAQRQTKGHQECSVIGGCFLRQSTRRGMSTACTSCRCSAIV